MADQKFGASEREAIWLAHEKKCCYTRELLDVSNFHIDHILPESLVNNPEEFEMVRARLGLNKDFNLLGFENLLPCKPSVNLQKNSLILEASHTRFFLSIASSKKPEIEKNLEQIEKRNIRGRALILLQQCLERGELRADELVHILEKYSEQPQEIFHLVERIRFFDAKEIHAITKADIDDLRNRSSNYIDGITLVNDLNEQIFVGTCKEYDTAINKGYYAITSFDIKMSTFFEHHCGLLKALEVARTPETSLIADPRVGIVDLYLIPFSIFPQLDPDCRVEDNTFTYQDKVDDGTLVVRQLRQNMLCIEDASGGDGQQLIEVMRADFNGDEIEDILLFEYCYAIGGSV